MQMYHSSSHLRKNSKVYYVYVYMPVLHIIFIGCQKIDHQQLQTSNFPFGMSQRGYFL